MAAYNDIVTAGEAYHKMQLVMSARELGIEHPSESTPVKVAKGIVTGTAMAAGLVVGGASSYYLASMLTGIINWEELTSVPVKAACKVGIVGLSSAAGVGVSKMFFETGDAVNDIIDSMADVAFEKKVSEAMEAGLVKEAKHIEPEED